MNLLNSSNNLTRMLDYPRRLLLTGTSFGLFGVGGLLIGLLAVPILALVSPSRERRQYRVRALIGVTMRAYVHLLQAFGLMVLRHQQVPTQASDPSPGLIVANHPSLLDAVILIGKYPQADLIVKADLYRNPFTSFAALGAGYISNADALDVLTQAQKRLAQGHTLIIFPEGTRTEPGQAPEFKLGAAALAVRSQRACLPIALHCAPPTLSKVHRWFHIPARRLIYTLVTGPIMRVNPVANTAERRQTTRTLNCKLNQWVNNELKILSELTARSQTELDTSPSTPRNPVANPEMNGHDYPLT